MDQDIFTQTEKVVLRHYNMIGKVCLVATILLMTAAFLVLGAVAVKLMLIVFTVLKGS